MPSMLSKTGWGLLAGLLFGVNAVTELGTRSTEQAFAHWRSFDDLALAVGYAARGEFPVSSYRVRDLVRRERDPRFVEFRARLFETIETRRLTARTPWRTVPYQALYGDGQFRLGRRLDDAGRPLLMGQAFRIAGGASPFLVFWVGMGAIACGLAWATFELVAAGRIVAAATFMSLSTVSAFLIDTALLGYSPAAFHVAGLLITLALSVYCAMGSITARGLAVRVVIAGLGLGVCALCRATVVSFLGGAALAVAVAVRRSRFSPGPGRGWLGVGLLGVALLAPTAVLFGLTQRLTDETVQRYSKERLAAYHDAVLFWKGLGDFDREKGYEFWDMAGQAAVRRLSPTGGFDAVGEARLRETILRDIASDPAWFAGILARRVVASTAFPKLWSSASRDGRSFVAATSKNEGVIDAYYALTRQADWFQVGRIVGEIPAPLLMLPPLLWLVRAVRARTSPSVRATALATLCLLLAALPTPILVTTATAIEPQSVVLAHFFLTAALAQDLLGARAP
jgi:hypothetical protein